MLRLVFPIHLPLIVASFGLLALGSSAVAGQSDKAVLKTVPPTSATVADVSLDTAGLLTGRVVDPNGRGVAERKVYVARNNKVVTQVATDFRGHFRIVGLTGGLYHLVAGDANTIVRVWSEKAAPPSARKSVLVTTQKPVVAGQSTLKHWLANPAVVGGLAAVAITVPVVIHNAQQDRDSGS